MRLGNRPRIWLIAWVLGLAVTIVILANSVNDRLPAGCEEVELASLPPQVLEDARRAAPGLRFQRAWKFSPGGQLDTAGIMGYVLRSRVNWHESRDIAVYASSRAAEAESPADLKE